MPRALLLLVPALVLVGAGVGLLTRTPPSEPIVEAEQIDPTATPALPVVVDVAGAVARPGVVSLPAGSRVIDALLAAGGMTGDADAAAINKAAVLRDGVRVYVPRKGEAMPAEAYGSSASEVKLNINQASERDLESLPGVGPATASRIVASRATKPFARTEELQTRGLVSARVFADIKDLVTIR